MDNLLTTAKRILDRVTTAQGHVEASLRGRPGDRYLEGFPRKFQLDGYSCGLQCALAVIRYFGVRLSDRTACDRLGTNQNGTTDPALRQFFRGMGFRVSTLSSDVRSGIERSIDRGAPLIVGVDRRHPHWIAVYGYGRGRIYVADPSLVRKRSVIESWSDFRRRWDGSGMIIEPSATRPCTARRAGRVIEIVE